LSGTAIAARGLQSEIDIWGVEPEAGDDFAQSLAAGERIKIGVPATIADGLQTPSPGALTFPIVRELARGIVTVSDEQLRAAMRFAFERLKIVIEPSGAAPLAALLFEKLPQRYARIGIVISGGNVDADRYGALIAD
jgi:threonine dehydratase